MKLKENEILAIEHSKRTGHLTITNSFGLTPELFTEVYESLKSKGLVSGRARSVTSEGKSIVIIFALKQEAIDLI